MNRIMWTLVALLVVAGGVTAVLATGTRDEAPAAARHTLLNRYGEIFGMLDWTAAPDGRTATVTFTKVTFSSYGKAGDAPRAISETAHFTAEEHDGSVVFAGVPHRDTPVHGRFAGDGETLTVDRSIGGVENESWTRGTPAEFGERIRQYQAGHPLTPCPEDPGSGSACG